MKNITQSIIQYVKSRKYILLFSVGYFLVRLFMIKSYFLLRDERDLILTALSLAQTGKDLYGHVFPLVFLRISPQAPLLGMYWIVPLISFFHITSPGIVKILYLLPTLFFPLLVFELVLSIIKEKRLSLLTSLVVSFSPWYFHISRLGIEAHLAYFLCLLGLILYLRNKKITGLLLLVLSYFSYFGVRPFLLLIIPIIELWNYFMSSKKSLKKIILPLIVFIILFGSVFILTSKIEQTLSRTNAEVIFLNKEKLTIETDFLRSISDAPFFMREFFDNKISVISNTIFYNFFKGIDFSYLFFSGDYVAIYSNQIMGQFFSFLFIFFILGIVAVVKKNKPHFYFMASFSILGLIASLINSYSLTFSIRSLFSLVGFGFICSMGLIYMYEFIQNRTWKSSFVIIMAVLYLSFSMVFIYKYLFQNYKTMNSFFNEQERYIAQYSRDHQVKTLYVPNIHSYFLSNLVTLPALSVNIFKQAQSELNKTDGYIVNGLHFYSCEGELKEYISQDEFPSSTIMDESCLSAKAKLFIDTSKSKKIVKLLTPEYRTDDVNRGIKYYYFK